jgi:hypothetical protein
MAAPPLRHLLEPGWCGAPKPRSPTKTMRCIGAVCAAQMVQTALVAARFKKNLLIQLADIVAGSILRTKQDKSDATSFYNLIEPRIENLWDFR